MPDNAMYEAVAECLRKGFQSFQCRSGAAEAEIRQLVIIPVLMQIGYEDDYRRPEQSSGRNRPDDICYATKELGDPGPAALIVEAKAHGTDFDRGSGGLSAASPDRQIQRYLRQHPASGPSTIGVLTDGIRWRVYERIGLNDDDIRFLHEYNFANVANPDAAPAPPTDTQDDMALRKFVDRLCRECVIEQQVRPRRPRRNLANALFDVFKDDAPTPMDVLPHLLGGLLAETHQRLADHVTLDGIRLDAHNNDWEDYAYAFGAPLPRQTPAQPSMILLEPMRLVTAAVRFTQGAGELSRADTAFCARTFARAQNAGESILLAYRTAENEQGEEDETTARLAVYANGKVAMTAPFNPNLPTRASRVAAESVLGVLADVQDELDTSRLLAPLEVASLRQQFYADVSAWTRRTAKGKERIVREAVLRHLIRTMFAWILKEDGAVPDALFERAFAAAALCDINCYHTDVLRFLFHKRLNVPDDRRDKHPNGLINDLMKGAPFLNGSLFFEQDGDGELRLAPSDYWSESEERPGLFTILSRYHWTTDEHRPGESEQTLDPELLSNMFERLILVIEDAPDDGERDRQPRGTYYTPADVTAEMVKDALAAATRAHAPKRATDAELLDLFGNPDTALPTMSDPEKRRLAERIHELRIFDPAVGSGAFLFSCLTALRTALEKLEKDSADPTLGIVREQLYGQDIHPLAAQITRLRLFIALKAADREAGRDAPLPNLEARIVCADTLETFADPLWRPDHPGRLDTAAPALLKALLDLAETRQRWMDAHEESKKRDVLKEYDARQGRLWDLLRDMRDLASPELWDFAETPLFPDRAPARTDARLLFYESPWRGFDVVIGNPPYEALGQSMSNERKKVLKQRKRYQTTNCNDLYTLFCEAALALANSQSGVVTFIVPLSIAFGQQQRTLRKVFEERCASINLRHYDNIPDTAFNGTPTLKNWKNRQRTTVISAVRQGDATRKTVKSSGLQRWQAGDREQVLRQRLLEAIPDTQAQNKRDTHLSKQWPRIPTPEVAQMVKAIHDQKITVADWQKANGSALAFPATAGYFIATVPPGAVAPRGERTFAVTDSDAASVVMAAVNGHVGYAWWRIYGDGFHVNQQDITTLAIPDAWADNPRPAIDIGKRLLAAVPQCLTSKVNAGTVWRNVDFHRRPDLIEAIDRLYIEALGLPVKPLLTHLKVMRSNRSWDFGAG